MNTPECKNEVYAEYLTLPDVEMNSVLPESRDVRKHSFVAWELANFIDGKRTMLEIAHAVLAECGGPMPKIGRIFLRS